MDAHSTDHIVFHSRLDERRQLERELARLRQLQRVRAGMEAEGDSLTAALSRSQAWERHGSYRELRSALDRLRSTYPTIAHVVVFYDVYAVQTELAHTARGCRDLGLRLLSRWMPTVIRLPSWLEPPREARVEQVGDMIANGYKTRRIARSLKISQGKAKRLARAATRAA